MEPTQPTAPGTCPSWCTTDHGALLYPDEPEFGTRNSHIGLARKLGWTHIRDIRHPGHEPEISVDNCLTGIHLHVSATESEGFLELIHWPAARGGTSTVRQFASVVEEAAAAIKQDRGHVPDRGGGR